MSRVLKLKPKPRTISPVRGFSLGPYVSLNKVTRGTSICIDTPMRVCQNGDSGASHWINPWRPSHDTRRVKPPKARGMSQTLSRASHVKAINGVNNASQNHHSPPQARIASLSEGQVNIIIHIQDQAAAMYCLGQVPLWLNEADPRSAREQINEAYRFGGWQPLRGNKARLGPRNSMCYPGDPPQYPFATIEFRDERIYAYPHEFWGIVTADGKAEFARLD